MDEPFQIYENVWSTSFLKSCCLTYTRLNKCINQCNSSTAIIYVSSKCLATKIRRQKKSCTTKSQDMEFLAKLLQ